MIRRVREYLQRVQDELEHDAWWQWMQGKTSMTDERNGIRSTLRRVRYNLRQLFSKQPAGCNVCHVTMYAWPCHTCGTWVCERCRASVADLYNRLYKPDPPLVPERGTRAS